MDILVFGFGLAVTMIVGTGLAIGITANNRRENELSGGNAVTSGAVPSNTGTPR